jgi:hypothetical protein
VRPGRLDSSKLLGSPGANVEPDPQEGTEYPIDHKPWGIAEGADIELSLRESDDGKVTRRVLRWHSGVKGGERRLSISLVHQRKARLTGDWVDQQFDLRQLKAGEEVTLDLGAEQTRKLIEHLDILREINERLKDERGSSYTVRRGDEVYVPPEFAAMVEQLRGASSPEDIASKFAQVAPDIVAAAGLLFEFRVRSDALREFRDHLDGGWTERDWQAFFERNDWIFGHGLNYRFLVTEQAHPNFGGADVTGRGDEVGDFLAGTVGDTRFAVLVEIKRPDTALVDGHRYRNGAWGASEELAGGVAQLQANCEQWQVMSRQRRNSKWAEERDITTAAPEGILVIGRTSTLADDEQRESFERFRNHLWNPKVITYDELFARASYIVTRKSDEPVPDSETEPASDGSWEDDLPF